MITGAADGNIIPTIITAHIANSPSQSAAPHALMFMCATPIVARICASMAFMAADSRSR